MKGAAARMGRQMARRSSRLPHGLVDLLSRFISLPMEYGSLHFFLTQNDPYDVTNLSLFAVVSLGCAVSVLMVPPLARSPIRIKVCSKTGSPLRPVPFRTDEKIFGFRACPNGVCQDSWLLEFKLLLCRCLCFLLKLPFRPVGTKDNETLRAWAHKPGIVRTKTKESD
jgi:hypothetical protein